VANEGTVIVCTLSQLYLAFLNNWLISLAKQGQHHIALIVADECATLDFVNEGWLGHVVSVPPAPDCTPNPHFWVSVESKQVSEYQFILLSMVTLLLLFIRMRLGYALA
jgi:hypothetical protein